jgi:hypothetical protein
MSGIADPDTIWREGSIFLLLSDVPVSRLIPLPLSSQLCSLVAAIDISVLRLGSVVLKEGAS